MYSRALCCAVLCCAVLCCAVLCCALSVLAVLCWHCCAVCAVLCCTVLCCAVLCCTVLCCAVLCCAVLCCAVLCCAVLCCAHAASDVLSDRTWLSACFVNVVHAGWEMPSTYIIYNPVALQGLPDGVRLLPPSVPAISGRRERSYALEPPPKRVHSTPRELMCLLDEVLFFIVLICILCMACMRHACRRGLVGKDILHTV